jgi:radical SAM superfamily enzyme YgiQ (UPF0313 family)
MKAILFTGYESTKGLERTSGAYRLATTLRREGWDVEVIDFFFLWSLEELKELIKSRNSTSPVNWIGFSCTWINYASEDSRIRMTDFLIHIKQNYPHIITMAGGQNPSLGFSMYNYVDYVITGFAEVAILEVLKYIYSNGKIKGIPRNNGWLIDANSFYPAWPISDLSIDYEERDFIHPGETLSLEFSRGCKFACAFCNFPVLGVKEDTTRDLSILETELKRNYELYGVSNYLVSDETINDRDEKLAKIGKVKKNLGIDLNFTGFLRGDILFSRPQQLELLAEAGIWGHYYGIESLNHESAKSIGKGLHPDKIKAGLLNTEEYFEKYLGKYRATVSIIYGLPHETIETALDGLKWLEKNWSRQSVVSFPLTINAVGNKSKIDNDYEKYGYRIIEHKKIKDYFDRHTPFADDTVVWENDHMNLYDARNLVSKQLGISSEEEIQITKRFGKWRIDSWSVWSLLGLAKDMNVSVKEILEIKERYLDIEATDSIQNIDPISQKGFELKSKMKSRTKKLRREYIQKKLSK